MSHRHRRSTKEGHPTRTGPELAGWCASPGIRTTGFFIVRHHVDTRETIDKTISFARAPPLGDVVVTINAPISGTGSYEKARKYGEYQEDDGASLNSWYPVFVPRGLAMLARNSLHGYRLIRGDTGRKSQEQA